MPNAEYSEGRSATLERGGGVVHNWKPRRGGLERGGDCSTDSRGPGWAVPWSWAVSQACIGPLWEPGEDPGVVGELEMIHGIRVQSDDGVVIIGGFFLSRIAVEQSFFPFGSEEDGSPCFVVTAEFDKVVGTVGLIV